MATVPGIAQYFTLSGRYGTIVGSQLVPLSGTVTFKATVDALLMAASTPPVTGLPEPVTAFLDADGDLATIEAGVPVKHVTLFPNNDPASNPSTGWNYTVTFDLTDATGAKVKRTGFNIDAPKGGAADLTQVSQVTPGTGTPITVGPPNTLAVGTVTTGAPGSAAAVSIHGAAPNQTVDLTIPRGDVGATGPVNTLTMGTVTTGAPGSSATASVTGAAPNQTLNLGLPQGATGPANTLAIGTVTTGAAGSAAAATITGAAPAQTLSLTVPKGDTGLTGNPGDMVATAGPAPVSGAVDLTGVTFPSTRIWSLTGNVTLTLPTPSAATSGTFTLVLTQDATGGRTITWPAGVKWPDGIAQQPASAANSLSAIHLLWTGTAWLGLVGGKSFA
jgi:hypothetical protein